MMQLIQPESIGAIGFRVRRIVVHFHENAVDAGCYCGPRQQWDKFRLAAGDCLAVCAC
jgi:hypothetical protein